MDLSSRRLQHPLLTSNRLTVFALIAITAFTDWRLIDTGLAEHLFDFDQEALNAVRAWEDHGFWSMVGMFSWGQGYLPPEVTPEKIYQRKTPLHLLHLWAAFKVFGLAGFPSFKLIFSLAIVSLNGFLLGSLTKLCFCLKGDNGQISIPSNLVFLCTYALTISNEAMLRFCLVDEPDYLGLTFWLATVVVLGNWLKKANEETTNKKTNQRPKLAICLGFFTSWIYPILGVVNLISLFLLQLFPTTPKLRRGLRCLLPGAFAGIALYWIQRTIATLLIPEKLYGSGLMRRMGMTTSMHGHDGLFDAIDFLYEQRSGGLPGFLHDSQIRIEHIAVWILGIVFFFIVLAKLKGIERQILLVLGAGGSWLFVPMLTQSLAMHGWVYRIHFMPSVVLGWIGGLTTMLPGHRSEVFGPGMLGFISLLIWVIQLRWFLLAYLS